MSSIISTYEYLQYAQNLSLYGLQTNIHTLCTNIETQQPETIPPSPFSQGAGFPCHQWSYPAWRSPCQPRFQLPAVSRALLAAWISGEPTPAMVPWFAVGGAIFWSEMVRGNWDIMGYPTHTTGCLLVIYSMSNPLNPLISWMTPIYSAYYNYMYI